MIIISNVKFVLHGNTKVNEIKFDFSDEIKLSFKGNILIKSIDANGHFVEIENIGNQSRDLTGWYIERTFDDRHINYKFPIFVLDFT